MGSGGTLLSAAKPCRWQRQQPCSVCSKLLGCHLSSLYEFSFMESHSSSGKYLPIVKEPNLALLVSKPLQPEPTINYSKHSVNSLGQFSGYHFLTVFSWIFPFLPSIFATSPWFLLFAQIKKQKNIFSLEYWQFFTVHLGAALERGCLIVPLLYTLGLSEMGYLIVVYSTYKKVSLQLLGTELSWYSVCLAYTKSHQYPQNPTQ